MTYSIKEIYYTLQGEGAQTGRAAVFLRFAGCNLWSGLERDRAKAVCRFCDTDFVGTNGPGGGVFKTADALADAVSACWKTPKDSLSPTGGEGAVRLVHAAGRSRKSANTVPAERPPHPDPLPQRGRGNFVPYVVCTGGEPLLQLDEPLIEALHKRGFEIGVETNGTQDAPPGLDWICVSPKANAELVLTRGNELKLIYPQDGAAPERYADLSFDHFFLQPMDCAEREANTRAATEYCLRHPQWRLSLQTHKLLGIP